MKMKNAIVGGKPMAHLPRNRKIRKSGVFGVGTNDADYCTQLKDENGKKLWVCPYYMRWCDMLRRCYDGSLHEKYPTYMGCTVCEEWLLFSTFRDWMIEQDWEGKHLDKDIIGLNRQYSPANCRFIDPDLNTLFNDCGSRRGEYPQGVSLHKRTNKYQATISIHGKLKHLGNFLTVAEASAAYVKAKRKNILYYVRKESDQALKNGLLRHYINLTDYEG